MIVSFCADVVLKEVYTIIGKVNHTSFCCNIKPASQCYYAAGILSDLIVRMLVCVGHHRRESRATDTESLCVLVGKLVWSIRIDLHILDNGGNLVDAANVAALAALLTFKRPECSLGGEDGQELTVHPPEDQVAELKLLQFYRADEEILFYVVSNLYIEHFS
ncbi:hypothetical protein BVRB_7g158780 [Beta vulgaris subsp. vulgaris]|nr:hypothetical protein BVRB_7g158780 [Beta vulgaris subsp. vulgaris]